MSKRKTYIYLMSGVLVLLFLCKVQSLEAAGGSEAALVAEVIVPAAAASAPASPTPATLLNEINEMREMIDQQRRQIEKLESALEQQQAILDKAVNASGTRVEPTAASVLTSPASSTSSAAAGNEAAQTILHASNTLAATSQPATNSSQTSTGTTKSEAAKSELPDVLKSFKPIGLFYISYQAGSKYSGTPDSTTDYNSFVLKRGYFGAEVALTPYLTSRFVSDITVDSTGDVKLRAKYMYGKFHWKGNSFVSSPYVEFGLAHMPWLDFEEPINGFRMQDTMFLERNGIFNSADVGVLVGSDFGGSMSSDYKSKVNSHYAGRYGSWQVGVYNGGGYHSKENNTNKAFEGRVTVRPMPGVVPGLQFSVLGVVGKGNLPSTNNIEPPDWRVFNGMVSYESQYFTFTGQGYFGTGNQAGTALQPGTLIAADQNGFSLFAAVRIPVSKSGRKMTLLGRMDEFNSNTATYTDIQRRYIGGIAFQIYKSNVLLFDFERLNHSTSTIPGEDRAQITLQMSY